MSAERRSATRALTAVTTCLLTALLVACGQTGPLTLPGEPTDAEVPIADETNDDEEQSED